MDIKFYASSQVYALEAYEKANLCADCMSVCVKHL